MTDISKYANISLPIKTYEKIQAQSEKLCGVKLSCSQTVTHAINLVDECMGSGLIPTAFNHLEPEVKKVRFQSIRKKLHNLVKLKFPSILRVVPKTAITKDEIEARNNTIYQNRVVANKMTLQQLGTMYNISRERVRQIQDHEVSTKKLNQQPKEKHASNN